MRSIRYLLPGLALIALLAMPASSPAKTIKVNPGGSIQAAVDAAKPGDNIVVKPGTYSETSRPCPNQPTRTCAVAITKDDITLNGKGATLVANGVQNNGIVVRSTTTGDCLEDPSLNLQGSFIKGITVRGFANNGIFMACVENWRMTRVTAIDNDIYGLFPIRSISGRIDHSFVSGANDTGFYVGNSVDVRMDHNVATDNVSGYEIENSLNVTADHNQAYGNTAGLLVFTLPGAAIEGLDNGVSHNTITDNDRPNTCVVPGDIICLVPPGTGVLIMASDGTLVNNNTVTGNDSYGIAVTNICVAQNIPPEICGQLDIQPDSDNTHVIENTVTGNGTNPSPLVPPVFAVDLAWDGTGTGNCWSNNVFDTEFPPGLSTLTC